MKQIAVSSPIVVEFRADRDSATPGPALVPRWSRRLLNFLCSIPRLRSGSKERQQAAAPSADEPSELDRIAIHESGHTLVARLRNRRVHSVTVVPNQELGFGGCAMIGDGSPVYRTTSESCAEVDSISRVIDQHMPRPGESREDIEPWLRSVHENVVELLAGAAAEAVVFGSANDRSARSDYLKAQRYARTITASDAAAEAFLEFALTEACEIVTPYKAVLRALADALIEHRELDAIAVDRTIAGALAVLDHDREVARQADWRKVTQSAAAFPGDRAQ
jgi:hypothetical protein